jgi:hypothetical protein
VGGGFYAKMITIKKYETGETKRLDDGSQDKALLIGCGGRTIISLNFDNLKATNDQVRELDRLLGNMGLLSVEVQTGEPLPHTIPARSIRRIPRSVSFWAN